VFCGPGEIAKELEATVVGMSQVLGFQNCILLVRSLGLDIELLLLLNYEIDHLLL